MGAPWEEECEEHPVFRTSSYHKAGAVLDVREDGVICLRCADDPGEYLIFSDLADARSILEGAMACLRAAERPGA